MNLEPASSDEINLLDLLIVLAKHKKNDLERDVCCRAAALPGAIQTDVFI
jgi:hypothetical protein